MKKIILMIIFLIPIVLTGQRFPTGEIQKVLDKSIDNKKIFGAVVSISKGGQSYHFASGNMELGDSYFIASITKLYTTAILFKLADQGKLSLDDPIKQYLAPEVMNALHIYKGNEYSQHITIGHLVSNTSGLADYFTEEYEHENSLMDQITSKGDTSLSFDQMIERTKQLPAKFPPGTKGKAYYSDGNFQLLGKIIQNITYKTMDEVYEEFIFKPLSLKETYLFSDVRDTIPTYFYYKKEVLKIPNMMSCFQSDGGIVSTAEESLIFLKSHLNGGLSIEKNTNVKTNWNKIYFPFRYGDGMMKFKFFGMPEMIGHAGVNGSFAYYIQEKDVYITGTINQINKPHLSYQLIAKILAKIKA